jgi:hypothetical protein
MLMMLMQIVEHTPVWVWGLLIALIALGLSQVRARDVSLARVTVLPLILIALSFSGVISTFAHSSIAILAWVSGMAASIAFGRHFIHPRGAYWSNERGVLHVPGSWLPLVLIVALFLIKYTVGVSVSMNPALAHDTIFAAGFSLAYGLFSGLFAGRALALRLLASQRTLAQAA